MKNRLRELREERNMSQKQLENEFYISKSAVSHYENGIRNIPNDLLVKFAEFFDTSVDYILGRDVTKRNEPK